MEPTVAGFNWNSGNLAKCQKHGVSIEEVEALFEGSPQVAPDIEHSVSEDRLLAVGRTAMGRGLFVVFMF
jgi:uncharacterized DUF497 family protein